MRLLYRRFGFNERWSFQRNTSERMRAYNARPPKPGRRTHSACEKQNRFDHRASLSPEGNHIRPFVLCPGLRLSAAGKAPPRPSLQSIPAAHRHWCASTPYEDVAHIKMRVTGNRKIPAASRAGVSAGVRSFLRGVIVCGILCECLIRARTGKKQCEECRNDHVSWMFHEQGL